MTNQIVYRQGDVALKLVDKPKGKVRGKFGQVLLARGETHDHAHILQGNEVKVLENKDGTTWVVVGEEGALFNHVVETTGLPTKDHDAIVVSPGSYEVVQQREYVPPRTENSPPSFHP